MTSSSSKPKVPVSERIAALRAKAASAPSDPGVYQMLDAQGRILYVGKAKSLRKRVASYFRDVDPGSANFRALTQLLVDNIADIRFIATANESEALFLENGLIKKEKPKYNVRLRDDKDYICLRLSIKHQYPRLTIVRRPKPDGALYFGPYASSWAIRKLTRYLLRLFPLRSCSDSVIKNRSRPCILYDIKLCTGPCVGHISTEAYGELVEQIRLFLQGNTGPLLKQLKTEMRLASQQMRYDDAAKLRDRIADVEASREQQHVIFHDHRDVDVIGWTRQAESMGVVILTMRSGKIIGKREIVCTLVDEEHALEMLETILSQHYLTELPFVPPQVLLPVDLPGAATLAAAFSNKMQRKIEVTHPKRGGRATLVAMANRNAELYLEQARSVESARVDLLEQVREALELSERPQRIECYDISNIQGTDAVGSQVTFINAQPDKQRYRKYKIRTVQGANDFAMLQEVLGRRFKQPAPEEMPQLVLIDGGKGQLSAAEAVLREIGMEKVPLASIAKLPDDNVVKGIESDRIFLPGRKNPLNLRADSGVLKLFQRMRDEAHRFAVAYHHKTKQKSTIKSSLSAIPGIGPKRQRELLRHFGSVERIRAASLDDLKALVGAAAAEKIQDYLQKNP